MIGTRLLARALLALLLLGLTACDPQGTGAGTDEPAPADTPPAGDEPGDPPGDEPGEQPPGEAPPVEPPPVEPPPVEPPPVEPPAPTPCPEGQERVGGNCVPTDLEETIPNELAEQVVGHYAIQMTIAMIQSVPILGELDNISTIHGFAEIRLDDEGELVITESGCGATSQTGNAISVEIPPAIPQSVTPMATPLTVWEEDGVIHWSRPLFVIPIGIRLDDPVNDVLPTDPSDARIWDQDGDGEPGVTVKVSGFAEGDIYVIQKQISSEHGTVDADGNLAGFVVDTSEQVVIGSTNPLLSQQIESRPNPDPNLSTLASVALDGPQDCEWLTANAAELFPADED